ncbi:MAG TPA: carboxypeptidase-like regulatory domain-containing protein, partial [Flavisolibacter sp.]|nr:carboxypeptidase-like regulatory domain-containing protein [Flavisolibacter sp.]
MKWDAYDKKRHQMPPSLLRKSPPRKRVLITLLFLFTISTIAEAQSITLSLKNVPMETAFKQIQSQSGYAFVYTTETIQDAKPVSLSLKNASLKTVLSELFLNQPLTYQLQDGFIMIRKKEAEAEKPSTHDISGVILTQTGQPLQGATVLVKGKNKATATDEKGRFYFTAVEDHDILVVSSIGFHRQEFTLSGQTFVQIRLDIAVSALDQTVVIAYGATTKRMNTGDISSLKGSEIEKQPVSNPLAAMEGRMPGVLVTQQTGVSGGGFSVQIRGLNSLRSDGNAPLYIVDGVPLTATSLV